MHPEIIKKIQELKNQEFDIGKSSGSEGRCSDGVGFFGHFEHGSIHWHPSTGAFETHGGINAMWASLGWEKGILGYPTSDENGISEHGAYGLTASRSGGQDIDWESQDNVPLPKEPRLSLDESYGRISYFQKGAIVYVFGSGQTSVFVRMSYGSPGIPLYSTYIPEKRWSVFNGIQ